MHCLSCLSFLVLLLLYYDQVTSESYLQADVLDYKIWTNSGFATNLSTTFHRIKVDNRFTNTLGGEGDLLIEIPCDAEVKFEMSIMIQQKFTPFHVNYASVETIINHFEDSTLGEAVKSLKKCTFPKLACPFPPGHYYSVDCTINTRFKTNLVAKHWNVTFSLWINKTRKALMWAVFELDDTTMNREKRPSSFQLRRRTKPN